jgi:hypothetical protein
MAIPRTTHFREMTPESIYTDEEIITRVTDKDEIARKATASKRKQILQDNLRAIVDAELRTLFVDVSYQSIKKYLDASQNIFLRTMKEISLVYQREPERMLEDGDTVQQSRLDEIIQETRLDLALDRANLLLNGLNDLVLMPIVVGKSISLAMFTPDQVTILGNSMDPSIPEAVVFEEKVYGQGGIPLAVYTFWSPTRHFKLYPDPANEGKFIHQSVNEKDVNPYAAVNVAEGAFHPMVFPHASYRDFGFWDCHSNTGLYEATVLIALQNTFKNFMVPQQFKQLAVKLQTKADGAWINDQVSHPLHIFQTNGEMEVLDWQSAIDKLDTVIQNKVAQVANDYGVSAEQMKLQISAQSGFSRLVAKERIYELRDKQIKLWRIYERDIYDALRAANNLYLTTDFEAQRPSGIPELPAEVTFTVDFAEPKVLTDPMEDLNVKQKKIDMGLLSPVDLIMAENPDLDSREKALERFQQNLEDRSLIEGAGGLRVPSLSQLSRDAQPGKGEVDGEGRAGK